jgi:hypothetical protein
MHGLIILCILYMLPYLFPTYSSSPPINGIALPLPPRHNHQTRLNPSASPSSFAPVRWSGSWSTCGTSRGCWRAKEMHTPRWRSIPIRNCIVLLRVNLGVQDHLTFKLTHRTHTTSDFHILHIHGKIRR